MEGPSTDPVAEEIAFNDIRNPDIIQKYKVAAEIATETLKLVLANLTPGKRIVELCELGDENILAKTAKVYNKGKVEKGIGFPTCVSVNNCAGYFSPLADVNDVLAEGDIVKVDVGVHVDGYLALAAETAVATSTPGQVTTGRAADVIQAAYTGAEVALRLLRDGRKNNEITEALAKVAAAFDCRVVEGVLSHQLKRYLIDGPKVVLGRADSDNSVDDVALLEGEVYSLDVIMSTGEGHLREQDTRTTVFRRNVDTTYSLKLKASRSLFSDINKRFPTLPFPLRAVDDERRGRLGITECLNHGLVEGFPVLYEKPGEIVAQFKFTALLLPSGTQRITLLNPPANIQSSHSVTDPELVALLQSSATVKKPRKNKKKAAGASSASVAADGTQPTAEDNEEEEPQSTQA